jgi:hypothetical protein
MHCGFGYLGGDVPFGYAVGDDGALVEDPEQQRAIKWMKQLRAKGQSLRAIQARLAVQGVNIVVSTIVNVLAAEARA